MQAIRCAKKHSSEVAFYVAHRGVEWERPSTRRHGASRLVFPRTHVDAHARTHTHTHTFNEMCALAIERRPIDVRFRPVVDEDQFRKVAKQRMCAKYTPEKCPAGRAKRVFGKLNTIAHTTECTSSSSTIRALNQKVCARDNVVEIDAADNPGEKQL